MISPLAKGDYEDLLAAGLPATLEDFDRLNTIALRLTNGPETTAANFPRIGWAGDVPFYQPTCSALSWYLEFVDRAPFETAMKNFCWYFALAHGRTYGAFAGLVAPDDIRTRVDRWAAGINATAIEIARACHFASNGFDDAMPAKTEKKGDATEADRRERSIANLAERVTVASAATGIRPEDLSIETPSRLDAMIEAVKRLNKCEFGHDESRLRADYDLTFREIRKRLTEEKDRANG